MGNVRETVIGPMESLYGPYGTDDADLVANVYCQVLARYADSELEAAFAAVAGTYMPSKRNPWPAPAFFVKAAEAAASARRAAKPPRPTEAVNPHAALAAKILASQRGNAACREGWGLGLQDFVLRHGRAPDGDEIGEIVDAARFVDRCAAGVGGLGQMHSEAARWANSILLRREALAKQVLGETQP